MSKKKGMFSWLGLGKKEQEATLVAEDVNENTLEEATQAPEEKSTTSDNTDENSQAEISPDVPVEETVPAELSVDVEQTSMPEVLSNSIAAEPLESVAEVIIDKEEVIEIVSKDESSELDSLVEAKPELVIEPEPAETESKLGFFARLKHGLTKTRQNLGGGIFSLFRGKKIDDELFEELETHLLLADVGVETTTKIIDSLTESASRGQLKDAEALYDLLKVELKKIIEPVSQPLEIPTNDGPFVILMVGVNGVGKTTTIGKLAKQFQAEGKSVMLAAGDTFRAAAVEQLQVWGERNDIPVVAQHTGADSASVIFDAISAAKARGVDVLIADTAGRLQNKGHLMEELKKVVRVMKKLDVHAPHEVMLTLDAGTGQNALSQTKLFNEAVGLTGLTLTKLDGTAKGGVVFAVADKHAIPIRYLGVGEGIDDLRPFNGNDFIDALFTQDSQED